MSLEFMWMHEDPRQNESDDSFEYSSTNGDLHVMVAKVGGGTVGQSYDGAWLYRVRQTDGTLIENGQFTSPWGKTHEAVADDVFDSFQSEEYS